ncbi:hypothetical protein OH764_34315 (plasmid) [Burkholderia sp. M6-3]
MTSINNRSDEQGWRATLLQAPGVELHLDVDAQGAAAILKDATHWRYFLLTELGLTVWRAIDGERILKDVVERVICAHPEATTPEVLQVVARLHRSNFTVLSNAPTCEVRLRMFRLRWSHPLSWDVHFMRGNWLFDRLYRFGGHLLFTKIFAFIALTVGIVGLILFASIESEFAIHPSFLPALGLVDFGVICVHECMHGLAVKHFRRRLGGVGFGLFWSGPVLFVDTSDMWLGKRAERMLVTGAGPAVEFVVAGAATIVATFVWKGEGLGSTVMLYSAICYARLLFNLCPLLEYDGYFILVDIVKCPNLRRRSIQWLLRWIAGPERWRILILEQNRIFAGYCFISFAYIGGLALYMSRVVYSNLNIVLHLIAGERFSRIAATSLASVFILVFLYGVFRDVWQQRLARNFSVDL